MVTTALGLLASVCERCAFLENNGRKEEGNATIAVTTTVTAKETGTAQTQLELPRTYAYRFERGQTSTGA
jgi:hypothetical protein